MMRAARRAAWLALAWAATAAAQAPADTLWVAPEVRPSVVRLGEPFTVRVAVPAAPGDSLLGPPAPTAAGDLDIVASATSAAGSDSAAWSLTLAWFATGERELPALPFLLRGPAGERPVATRPYVVSVEPSVPADSAAVRDLAPPRDPLPAPTRWRAGRVALVLGLLAAAAALVAWLVRRRRPEVRPMAVVEPDVPPHVEALAALDALAAEAWFRRGRVKEHYLGLSHLLRVYVERRWRVPAVESTTDEIRVLAGRLPGDLPVPELLDQLDHADLVKFARLDPGPERADEDLAAARRWVERTAPRTGEGVR